MAGTLHYYENDLHHSHIAPGAGKHLRRDNEGCLYAPEAGATFSARR